MFPISDAIFFILKYWGSYIISFGIGGGGSSVKKSKSDNELLTSDINLLWLYSLGEQNATFGENVNSISLI